MLQYPQHIDLESTNYCNAGKCIMCPYPIMERAKGFMSVDLLKKITDELKGKGVITSYNHMIGEPFTHPQIFDLIALVSKAGIRTSISTNGILLKKRRDEILNSRLNEFTIALDGITKQTYERYRKGISFEEVLFNTFDFLSEWSLRKSKIHVQLQLIIMRENQKEIGEFKKTFSKFSSRGSFEILCKGYSTFAGRVKDLAGGTAPRRFGCVKPFREFSVSWDGLALLCCRNYDNFIILGDLNKESVYDIWHNKEYQKVRDLFIKGKQHEIILCRNC